MACYAVASGCYIHVTALLAIRRGMGVFSLAVTRSLAHLPIRSPVWDLPGTRMYSVKYDETLYVISKREYQPTETSTPI